MTMQTLCVSITLLWMLSVEGTVEHANRDVLTLKPMYDATEIEGFDRNFRVCVHAPFHRTVDDEEGDVFYENGRQQLLGYEIWAHYVNYEKKGIAVGDELWGVELVVLEDFSDPDVVGENTDKCLGGVFGEMNWMFAPYSSALTNAALQKMENSSNILIAAGSNLETVWTPDIEYGYTLYFAQGSYYDYSFPIFAANTAKSVVAFCSVNSASNVSLCTPHDQLKLNQSAVTNGMTLISYSPIDFNSSTYFDDILKAIDMARDVDVDILVINDFSKLCIDMIEVMRKGNWTPRALYLVECSDSLTTREAIGEQYLQYATAYRAFDKDAEFISGISGYSPQSLNELFTLYGGTDAAMTGVTAFAGGEVMLAAIEVQSALNFSLVTDPTALNSIIKNGTWDTVLSQGSVKFGPSNIAEYSLYTTQWASSFEVNYISHSTSLIYPMPSWGSRDCERETNGCSGHGTCVDENCVCDSNYYDGLGGGSCDTFCIGEIVGSSCRSDRTYSVGVLLQFSSAEFLELESHLRLAMELVNNKTLGWFSSNMNQVNILWRLNDSDCDFNTAREMLIDQEEWAYNVSGGEKELDGLVGAYCSSSSEGIASHGARTSLPQISPSASKSSLSNKEMYPYFTRTCADNKDTSDAIVSLFEDLGLAPNIAIVYDDNAYAKDLRESIYTGWTSRGHNVIGLLDISKYDTYEEVIEKLAMIGSPVIVLCMYNPEVITLLSIAQNHQYLGSDDIVWCKTDWTLTDEDPVSENSFKFPLGMISLQPHANSTSFAKRYMKLWNEVNPAIYLDANGDRNNIVPTAGSLVDAVFSLATAFQLSINDDTGYSGASLRQYVVTKLQNDVYFEGVSGPIDFNINGDQIHAAFDVLNYQMVDNRAKWQNVGFLMKDISTESNFLRELNYSGIVWPDGSSGVATSYSSQLEPFCPPGYTVEQGDGGAMTCGPCVVGKYKAYYGSDPCTACPTGTDCSDIGIVVPCLLPGFWRDEPPPGSLGDFETYTVFNCDIESACLGGCYLNNTCNVGRVQSSPTCGVCSDGYFLNGMGGCDSCSNTENSTYVAVSFSMGILFFVVVASMLFSLQIKKHRGSDDYFGEKLSMMFQNVRIHYRKAASTQQLLLSFLQIIVGVQFYLQVDWPSQFTSSMSKFSLNMFKSISASNACNSLDSYYYLELMLWFVSPFVLICSLALISGAVYLYCQMVWRVDSKLQTMNSLSLWNLFCKLCLWIFLVFSPQLSYVMLTYFQCRDFGLAGQYMRVQYDINCDTSTYEKYSYMAGVGVALYSFGIPVLFGVVILYRYHPLLATPSQLLYINFKPNFCYFEIFQLVRKFLLTSALIFVSEPGKPSMALYLLVVDIVALVLLALFCPYASGCDNFLAMTLVSVECCIFLVAFIVTSGVDETDNYSERTLFNFLYIIILFSTLVIVPFTFALKFQSIHDHFQDIVYRIFFIPKQSWGQVVERRNSRRYSNRKSTVSFINEIVAIENQEKLNNHHDKFDVEMTTNPITSTGIREKETFPAKECCDDVEK